MNWNVVYVGVDVDDVRYHGCALGQGTAKVVEFHRRATLKGLAQQLESITTVGWR